MWINVLFLMNPSLRRLNIGKQAVEGDGVKGEAGAFSEGSWILRSFCVFYSTKTPLSTFSHIVFHYKELTLTALDCTDHFSNKLLSPAGIQVLSLLLQTTQWNTGQLSSVQCPQDGLGSFFYTVFRMISQRSGRSGEEEYYTGWKD